MAYTPLTWVTNETAVSAANMNHIEQGIYEAHAKLEPTALAEALLDFFHPVGMYFETKDASFNPNTAWGGTWELETEGLVHVSGGANYPVTANAQDGGEATHTLTTDEMPSHNHGLWDRGVYTATGSAHALIGWNGGTAASTTSTGGGQAHNNMQPYKNVYRWLRTA